MRDFKLVDHVAGQGPVTITANVSTEIDSAWGTLTTCGCSPRAAPAEATVSSPDHPIIIQMFGALVHASTKY